MVTEPVVIEVGVTEAVATDLVVSDLVVIEFGVPEAVVTNDVLMEDVETKAEGPEAVRVEVAVGPVEVFENATGVICVVLLLTLQYWYLY